MKKRPARKMFGTPTQNTATQPAKPPEKKVAPLARQLPERAKAGRFDEVLSLIPPARHRACQAVNIEFVGLYCELGGDISRRIARAEWGDGVVDELAAPIAQAYPGQRGLTSPNPFRMRQFIGKASVREKSNGELLEHYGLSVGGVLTNLGLLLIGKAADRARMGSAQVVQAIRLDSQGKKVGKLSLDNQTLSPIELLDAIWTAHINHRAYSNRKNSTGPSRSRWMNPDSLVGLNAAPAGII